MNEDDIIKRYPKHMKKKYELHELLEELKMDLGLLVEPIEYDGYIEGYDTSRFEEDETVLEINRILKRYDYLIKRVPINKRYRDRMRKLFP